MEPPSPKLIGGVDYSLYQRSAEQIDATHFLIRHREDESKNINIVMHDDEEGKHIEWDGMPKSMVQHIEKNY